jgi:hypothetical protein
MAEIKWERDFNAVVGKAKKSAKPIFQDFWYDG